MRWATFALFQAEEWDITTANLADRQKDETAFVQKFLGVKDGFGKDFGVADDFVASMIKSVGNYGEIYDRNLGPKTPYFIDRAGTPNAMWTKGGAEYSPPWN